jgi:hydroxymethylpyrimidine pyrophosphatase-like HAD family hydrolase
MGNGHSNNLSQAYGTSLACQCRMPLSKTQYLQLQHFFNQSAFAECGAVITDLDGTAIHEFEGRYSIPQSVELGLEKIYALGRPVIINTLRFPLSVMRTFAKEWYQVSNAPIPTILMNGSQLGFITQPEHDFFDFQEIAAFTLQPDEIDKVLEVIKKIVDDKVSEFMVFYYPRDWKKGENIWVPVKEKIETARRKYLSASAVIAGDYHIIEAELKKQDICMVFLLIDLPHDRLMAYQHTKKANFFNSEGVDKRSGTEYISQYLKFDLKNSLGAGDSEMDNFLEAVGQAVHVGNPFLKFEGLVPPIRLRSSAELGELLGLLADMQKTLIH